MAAVTPPVAGDWKRTLGDREQRALEAFEQRYGQFGGRERRHGIPFVLERASDSGDPDVAFIVRGHAAVYNRKSLDLGGFVEVIEKGFFDEVLDSDPDVHALWDHSTMLALARTRSSKYLLELRTDPRGLHYYAKVAPTSFAADLRVLMEGGVIDQSSFAFTVAEDKWEIVNRDKPDEYVLRRLLKCRELFDVTICAQGAYPATDSQAVRSAAVAFARSSGRLDDAPDQGGPVTRHERADDDPSTDPATNPEPDTKERSAVRTIDNEADLRNAIRALLRENDKDAERSLVITRAEQFDMPGLIPENWDEHGALRDGRALTSREERETHNDLCTGLSAALDDLFVINGDYWYVWVQDFTDTEVIFSVGGDLYKAPYTVTAGPIEIGEHVKVRPITTYVETEGRTIEPTPGDVKSAKFAARRALAEAKSGFVQAGRNLI